MMRRLLPVIVTGVLALGGLTFALTAQSNGGAGYQVKVIFDTASNLNVGSNFQVAGVNAGTVTDIELTEGNKAAVTIEVTQDGIAPFKEDARCEIVVATLIGEQAVQCEPGSAGSPPLEKAPGEDHPVVQISRTLTPVPADIVLDSMGKPEQERFRIILMELGISLAGRGEDLNEALRRSNPSLKQANEVLAILARQNRQLADLVSSSDSIMSQLAENRDEVADSVVQINKVAQATAAQGDQLGESIDRLPALLRQLRPTLEQLGDLSDEAYPIVRDLHAVAPDLSRLVVDAGPFADEAVPALQSLGDLADQSGPVLTEAQPLIQDLDQLTKVAKPASQNLADLLESLKKKKGIESLMNTFFYFGNLTAPYDSISHFSGARLVVNGTCVFYETTSSSCSTKFGNSSSGTSSAAAAASAKSKPATPKASKASQNEVNNYLLGEQR